MNNRILNMLGLAMKAGKLISGESSCEKSIRARRARLILLATDASENTKKKFNNASAYYQVPCVELDKKEVMGSAVGKEIRAVMVIEDENFANGLGLLFDGE